MRFQRRRLRPEGVCQLARNRHGRMAVDEFRERARERRRRSGRQRGGGGRPRLVVAEETYCLETAALAVHEREVLLAQEASERLRQGHRLEVGGHLARLAHLASNFGAALPREFL